MENSIKEASAESPREIKFRMTELFYLGIGIAFIYLICVSLSAGRIFWCDEVLGWTVSRDPSWKHMFYAMSHGADGGHFIFYAGARGWFSVFGASVLSFRMYSATAFALAFVVLWITLRRFYEQFGVGVSLIVTWCSGNEIVGHIAEGRFYGLFFLGASLVFAITVKVLSASKVSLRTLYLGVFFSNLLIVEGHLFGILYSAVFLAAVMIHDWLRKDFRPTLYSMYVLPWTALLPEIHGIWATLQMQQPRSWTRPPTLGYFVRSFCAFDYRVGLVLGGGAFLCAYAWRSRMQVLRRVVLDEVRKNSPVLIPALAMCVVPVIFAVKSFTGPSIFVYRYLLPIAIIPMVIVAQIFEILQYRFSSPRRASWNVAGACVLLCALASSYLWITRSVSPTIFRHGDYVRPLSAALDPESTVVIDHPLAFYEVRFLTEKQPHYVYLLDWPRALDVRTPALYVGAYNILKTWRELGYFPNAIYDRSSFEASQSRFFVVETRFDEGYPGRRGDVTLVSLLREDPKFQVLPYRELMDNGVVNSIWLVCRTGTPCS